jgi:rubrerythrin
MSNTYDKSQLHELLYQALETEIGGIEIYTEALKCVVDEDLRGEWEEYLQQTKTHRQVLEGVLDDLSLDPNAKSPGREVVKHIGASLVEAMRMARKSASETDAELVAAECVVLAETKDHSNWELLGQVADHCGDNVAAIIREAYDEVEDEEDHHLYHTKGFCRELWLKSLGLPAVIPPPEERKNVETAIGASRAEHQREEMIKEAS